MKKFFAILLAMTMIFALVACGGPTTDDTAKDDASKASEAAPAASADSDVQKDFELEDCKQYAKDVDTKGMTFYWVGKVLGGTYWTGVETGMTAAADELGIEIIMQGVEKETDIDVQLNNLQNAPRRSTLPSRKPKSSSTDPSSWSTPLSPPRAVMTSLF